MQEPIVERQHDRFGLIALGVVGAAAALLNLGIVRQLAVAAGYSELASWLYWLVLDFFAVIGMRAAFRAKTVKVRAWAGVSSVLALVLSSAAAGLHVFIEGGLPKEIAFGVLCLPAVMLGLSLHLVLLTRLEQRDSVESVLASGEGRSAVGGAELAAVRVAPALVPDRDTDVELTETVTHQRQVTQRRGRGADVEAALALLSLDDPRNNSAIADDLATELELSSAHVRKIVAQWRPKVRAVSA